MWKLERVSGATLVLLIGATVSVVSRPTAAHQTAAEEDTLDRILELRQELERLLESLSPEERQEVERRWRERQETKASDPLLKPPIEPAVEPTPAPVTEPISESPPIPTAAETGLPQDTEVTEQPPAIDSEPLAAPSDDARSSCGTLAAFDSNDDGVLSASDRYWRYFLLSPAEGGELVPTATETLYDQGIREIGLELDFFKTSDDTTGDISVADRIHLRLVGKRRKPALSGILILEAGRLARGGEVHLADEQGAKLVGLQAIRPGVALVSADGTRRIILCP
jgi:hypothetical protein